MASIPTLVQSVATGIDIFEVTTFHVPFPNFTLPGNLLTLGFIYNSGLTLSSVKDNNGNSWTAVPSATFTNATYSVIGVVYYLANAPSSSSVILTFTGTSSPCLVQCVFKEYYNVAQSFVIDGAVASSTSKSPGTITTIKSGDLLLQWGWDLSDLGVDGGVFNGTSITAGSGWTLDTADLQIGVICQYQIQATSGAISPTFTTTGASTWGSIAVAFTPQPGAGTAPIPGAMLIVHVQYTSMESYTTAVAPIPVQFPSQGNLLVGTFNRNPVISITDSASNTWMVLTSNLSPNVGATGYSQIFYAPNATTSPTLNSITLNTGGTFLNQSFLILYDVVNASPTGVATFAISNGTNSVSGPFSPISIQPAWANGIVFAQMPVQWNTEIGVTTNFGTPISSMVYNAYDNQSSTGTAPSTLMEDNAEAHLYNTDLTTIAFTFAYNTGSPFGTPNTGVGLYAAIAAAFAPATASTVPLVLQKATGTASSGTTVAATFGGNTKAGSTIVAIVNAFGTTNTGSVALSGVAVSGGGTALSRIIRNVGGSGWPSQEGWACANEGALTAPTVTATLSGDTVSNCDITIYEITNMPSTIVLDGIPVGNTGSASNCVTGNITVTGDPAILFSSFSPFASMTGGEVAWSQTITTGTACLNQYLVTMTPILARFANATQSSSSNYSSIIFSLKGIQIPRPGIWDSAYTTWSDTQASWDSFLMSPAGTVLVTPSEVGTWNSPDSLWDDLNTLWDSDEGGVWDSAGNAVSVWNDPSTAWDQAGPSTGTNLTTTFTLSPATIIAFTALLSQPNTLTLSPATLLSFTDQLSEPTTLAVTPQTLLSFTPQLSEPTTLAINPATVLSFTPQLSQPTTLAITSGTTLVFTDQLSEPTSLAVTPQTLLSFTPQLSEPTSLTISPATVLSFTDVMLTGLPTTLTISSATLLSFTDLMLTGLPTTLTIAADTILAFTPLLSQPTTLGIAAATALSFTPQLSEPTSLGITSGTTLSFTDQLSQPTSLSIGSQTLLSFTDTMLTGLPTTFTIAPATVLSFTPVLLIGEPTTFTLTLGTQLSFTGRLTQPNSLGIVPGTVLSFTDLVTQPNVLSINPETILSMLTQMELLSTLGITSGTTLLFTPNLVSPASGQSPPFGNTVVFIQLRGTTSH